MSSDALLPPAPATHHCPWLIPALVGLALLVWLAWWGANYPAIMTPDSVDQWQQIRSNRYNDWHPIAHTLLIKATALAWVSPAAMVVLQLLLLGLVVRAMLRELGAAGGSDSAIAGAGLYYALHPIHGQMACTLWKDVPFSLAIACFTLGLLRLTSRPNQQWRAPEIAALGASGMAVLLLRHQGIAVVTFTLVGLAWVLPAKRKIVLFLLGLLLAVGGGWQLLVHRGLGLTGSPVTEMLAVPLQQAAAIATTGGTITPEQCQLLEAVAPWKYWSHQESRRSVDWLKFAPEFDPAPIPLQADAYFRLWLDLIRQNPSLTFRAWLWQTMVVWHPGQDAAGTVTTGISANAQGLAPAPWSEGLAWTAAWLRTQLEQPPLAWTVRPSWLHALLLAAGWMSYRYGGALALVPFMPLLAILVTLVLMMPTPDFRYFYPTFLVAPLLLVHPARCRLLAGAGSPTTTTATTAFSSL